MKTKTFKPFLMLAFAVSSFSAAYANDAILDSDPIDVTGYVKEAPVTDHELETVKNELRKQKQAIIINKEKSKKYNQLGRSTEKLADATEEMIEERKESQAVIDKYNKKIKCLMETAPGPECDEFVKRRDRVSVSQAAPAVVAAPKVQKSEVVFMEEIKVNPILGLTMIDSQYDQLESNVTAGVRVESDINNKFSVALGFTYANFDIQDNQFSSFFFNHRREINYKSYKFDLSGKYYLTKTSRFRPYIGAGIAFNRSISKFNDSDFVGNFNPNYQNEDLTTSHVSGSVMAGAEITLTKMIGLNVEAGYSRGFGSSFNTQRNSPELQFTEMARLEQLDSEISEANIFTLNAGMMIYF